MTDAALDRLLTELNKLLEKLPPGEQRDRLLLLIDTRPIREVAAFLETEGLVEHAKPSSFGPN